MNPVTDEVYNKLHKIPKEIIHFGIEGFVIYLADDVAVKK